MNERRDALTMLRIQQDRGIVALAVDLALIVAAGGPDAITRRRAMLIAEAILEITKAENPA